MSEYLHVGAQSPTNTSVTTGLDDYIDAKFTKTTNPSVLKSKSPRTPFRLLIGNPSDILCSLRFPEGMVFQPPHLEYSRQDQPSSESYERHTYNSTKIAAAHMPTQKQKRKHIAAEQIISFLENSGNERDATVVVAGCTDLYRDNRPRFIYCTKLASIIARETVDPATEAGKLAAELLANPERLNFSFYETSGGYIGMALTYLGATRSAGVDLLVYKDKEWHLDGYFPEEKGASIFTTVEAKRHLAVTAASTALYMVSNGLVGTLGDCAKSPTLKLSISSPSDLINPKLEHVTYHPSITIDSFLDHCYNNIMPGVTTDIYERYRTRLRSIVRLRERGWIMPSRDSSTNYNQVNFRKISQLTKSHKVIQRDIVRKRGFIAWS